MRTSASLLLLLSARHTIAAAGERPSDTLTVRGFDAERIAALRSDPAHQYEHDIVREPTWWELLKEWLADWFSGLFGGRVGSFGTGYLFPIFPRAPKPSHLSSPRFRSSSSPTTSLICEAPTSISQGIWRRQ